MRKVAAALVLILAAAHPAGATTNMYGLLWYGQSLSNGAWGQPILTPFAPNGGSTFMLDGGACDADYSPNHGSNVAHPSTCYTMLVPAYDSWFSSLANTTVGQSSITPMAEALVNLEGATPTSPYFMLELGMGVGGYNDSQLASGTVPYTNLKNSLTAAVSLMPPGFVLNVPAVPYVQGEADSTSGTTRSAYASDLATLQTNLTSDIETITSQSNAPFLMLTQETNCYGPFGTVTQAQSIIGAEWDAAVANPTKIVMVTPNYVFENNAYTSGHLTARGYFYMGEYMARAYHTVAGTAQGGLNSSWSAPMPTTGSISNVGNLVTIPFTGGTAPYQIDCSYVTSPNGGADGFYYTDTSGSPPHIVSVAASGNNILLTLSSAPSHAVTGTVEYAWSAANGEGTTTPGPTSGLRGCMHDSDPYVSLLDGRPLPNYSIAWNASFTTN